MRRFLLILIFMPILSLSAQTVREEVPVVGAVVGELRVDQLAEISAERIQTQPSLLSMRPLEH